jgi:hypothetical protein
VACHGRKVATAAATTTPDATAIPARRIAPRFCKAVTRFALLLVAVTGSQGEIIGTGQGGLTLTRTRPGAADHLQKNLVVAGALRSNFFRTRRWGHASWVVIWAPPNGIGPMIWT